MTTMIQNARNARAVNWGQSRRIKCFTVPLLFALMAALFAWPAAAQDNAYLDIYGVIDQADTLAASGKTSQAHAKYLEAQWDLAAFQRANPAWNSAAVHYRMKYLAEKVAATAAPAVAAGNDVGATAKIDPAFTGTSPVTLLDAGSEPRTVLRLHPTVGDKQTMNLTMKMAMDLGAAANGTPAMDLPAMLTTVEFVVKNVSPTGDITYEMLFTGAGAAEDPNVTPAVAAAMKSSLAGIRGVSGTSTISSQGIVREAGIKLPAGADPALSRTVDQMKDSFSSSANVLPDAAVGAGARWEYKTRLKSGGITMDQTVHYELVAIEGDKLTLRSTITQSAASQKVLNPMMPGLKADLNQLTGAGTGSTTLDLGKVMPLVETLEENTEIIMGVNVGQKKQSMDTKMNVKLTLESK
jgi:hypothetical protein